MPYRILSLDGGGIRGLYSARILERLDAEMPGFLGRADLLAGTSTGGIIALALARGLHPSAIVDLYRDHADEIFDDSWLDDLLDLGGLSGAEYDNRKLKRILARTLGADTTLSQLRKRVLIPTFDLDNLDDPWKDPEEPRTWKAKFFHNFPGNDSDGDQLAVDVALRTSAAPTYFPSYQGYIDGGVVANNPAVAAIAQALDRSTGGQKLDDLRLLSISTGSNPTFIGGHNLDWGYAQWAKPLINLMIDGVMGVADYQCRRLLRECYHRVDQVLPEAIKLDDHKRTKRLIELADEVNLAPTLRWLERQWT